MWLVACAIALADTGDTADTAANDTGDTADTAANDTGDTEANDTAVADTGGSETDPPGFESPSAAALSGEVGGFRCATASGGTGLAFGLLAGTLALARRRR